MVNLLAIPGMISLGSFNIALLDVIALVFLIIAFITGLCKGFMKQVVSFLGLIAALIVASLLCTKLAGLIIEKGGAIYHGVENLTVKTFGLEAFRESTAEGIRTQLASSKVPAFLHEVIVKAVEEQAGNFNLVATITGWALNILSFIVLVIVSLIIFAILKKLLVGIASLPVINIVDKLLGIVFSLAKCLVVMSIICMVLSIFLPLNTLLMPEGGTCILNKVLEFFTNLPLIKNLITSVI